MKFPYVRFPSRPSSAFPRRHSSLRPVIPIRLLSKNSDPIKYFALIDSGADDCIFHASIGEAIGIDIKSGASNNYEGIGEGKIDAYFHTIPLEIGGWEFKCFVGFSYHLGGDYGILGQNGFFDLFVVELDLKKEEVQLKWRNKAKKK